MASAKAWFDLLKRSFKDFGQDECPRMAAALSYYTIFSLPPLLILILLLVGAIWDPQDVQGAIRDQIAGLMGPSAAEEIQTMIAAADRPGGKGIASLLGVIALIAGATGAFGELQSALNRAWEVQPDPKQGGIRSFLMKRIFSFGMILVIAFLLLVSLALSAALAAFGHLLEGMLPGILTGALLQLLNLVVSLAVITLLFALMFKVLPDAKIAWRDVWVGAGVTALLFVIGKFLIGLYLGRSNPGEAFGAAGSLALILVWIYYSALILFFGAEFTQRWAESRGSGIEPEEGAVRVVERDPVRGEGVPG